MPIDQVFHTVAAILVSLGGGGAIVMLMSSALGRLWADRLMAAETAKHQSDLVELQAALRKRVDGDLAEGKMNLDIFREKHLKGHSEKLTCYRLAIDVIVEILGDLDFADSIIDGPKRGDAMNRGRMRAYGYLAMLAPQAVMTGFDNLFDYVFSVIYDNEPYRWTTVRQLSLELLNEVRKDIGVDIAPISYFGTR